METGVSSVQSYVDCTPHDSIQTDQSHSSSQCSDSAIDNSSSY
jgi:hypothetical protein